MAQLSRSTKIGGGTTLQANTLARAADVETDILTLFNAHNNHDTGTSKWGVVSAEDSSSIPLLANNSTGTQNIFEARDNGTAVLAVADGGTSTITVTGGSAKGLVVNNGTSTGNILEAQDNGTARLTVADGGTTTITAVDGGSAKALIVNNGTSTGNILELQDGGVASVTLADGGVFTVTGQLVGKGTATNDAPSAGYIGEVKSSAITTQQNVPTTDQWGDLTSLALTAGNWQVYAQIRFNTATSTGATSFQVGVSSTSGNNSTGLTAGDTLTGYSASSSITGITNQTYPITVPPIVLQLSGSTTYYLKYLCTYTNGQPLALGKLVATRIR
jgi:hypothetical protein